MVLQLSFQLWSGFERLRNTQIAVGWFRIKPAVGAMTRLTPIALQGHPGKMKRGASAAPDYRSHPP